MLKTYSARTQVSISVVLKNKKSVRVSFSPRTMGGSLFYTKDAELQEAIEKHPQFGKLFKLENTEVVKEEKAPIAASMKEIKVASLEDAKDYLKENYGIDWRKLKTSDAIMSIGKENGIQFVIE